MGEETAVIDHGDAMGDGDVWGLGGFDFPPVLCVIWDRRPFLVPRFGNLGSLAVPVRP